MVLCHNDLFYKNILFSIEKQKYLLIDFEYSGYDMLGIDLANIFNEIMFDYKSEMIGCENIHFNLYPKESTLTKYYHFYLFCI